MFIFINQIKIMNHLKLIALFIFINIFSSQAQKKYKAYYDYQSDQMLYFELDNSNKIIDTLNSASIKRGSILIIEVDNVNPFALSTETNVSEESIHKSKGGFNFSGLLGNIQKISGGNLASNVPELPSGDIAGFGISASRGGAGLVDNLEKLTVNLRSLNTSLRSYMRNPNLTKDEIIDKVKYLASLFEDQRLPDPEDNLYLFLETLESLIRSDSEKLKAAINSSDIESSRGASTTRTLRSFTEYNADEVNNVTDLYSSVEAASFKQVYDYVVKADRTLVEMKFTPISENSKRNDDTPIKTRSISVKARGGFKINSSVAITLNNFKKA